MKRGRFTGVANIVRFNWPFFVAALGLAVAAGVAIPFLPGWLAVFAALALVAGLSGVAISIAVSWYVYDASGLYDFDYLDPEASYRQGRFANIHAGFDESTEPLKEKFPDAVFRIFDFYDPERHTEASIRRARAKFAAPSETVAISTDAVPVEDRTFDIVFLIFAAHEIRDEAERIGFFRELRRIVRPGGKVYVVEHLRDWRNALAYSFGCLHFHSRQTWERTFDASGWGIESAVRPNPFVIAYTLA